MSSPDTTAQQSHEPHEAPRARRDGVGTCPACASPGTTFRRADAVGADLREASRWWHAVARAARMPFQWPVHGRAARLAICPTCGTLWRATPGLRGIVTEWYRRDRYDARTLALFHDAEHESLLADGAWLSRHVAPGARVLEIGSYVGAFLRYAAGRGCDVVGIDVGDSTRRFCRGLGYDVHAPDDVDVAALGPFDAVWILNCFDQLPDPAAILDDCRAALVPGGLLVIRTPDAAAIHAAYRNGGRDRVRALAGGLWGVPFLHCFTRPALASMLGRAGFADVEFRSRGGTRPGERGWCDVTARRAP